MMNRLEYCAFFVWLFGCLDKFVESGSGMAVVDVYEASWELDLGSRKVIVIIIIVEVEGWSYFRGEYLGKDGEICTEV